MITDSQAKRDPIHFYIFRKQSDLGSPLKHVRKWGYQQGKQDIALTNKDVWVMRMVEVQ